MSDKVAEYKALVGRVVDGKHGLYAVSHHEKLGTVTFALSPDVWSESKAPTRGTYVMLSDIQKKRSGWRAMKARFFRPSDDEASSSNQQQKEGDE